MNCDEAFDALTDPTGRDNSALKWHLEFCPRCREMREVLAPALAMLSAESLADEDSPPSTSNRLPALFSDVGLNPREALGHPRCFPAPFLTPEAVRLAEQAARTLHPARKLFSSQSTRWVLAGAACVLASLGLYFAMASSEPASPRHSDPMILADQCLWMERNVDNTTAPAEPPSSRWVVLSCVACHLEHSLE